MLSLRAPRFYQVDPAVSTPALAGPFVGPVLPDGFDRRLPEVLVSAFRAVERLVVVRGVRLRATAGHVAEGEARKKQDRVL